MNSPFGNKSTPGAPKFIIDFSKALANEVKILLGEVGKLRDEKRALEFEISELMAIKAKHSGSGAMYASGWMPPPPAPEAPPAPEPPAAPPAPAPGGWRTVHPAPVPRRKLMKAVAAPPPPPAPAPPPPAPDLPAWAQWRPNPLLNPGTAAGPAVAVVVPPVRTGLFGTRTPPPK
ncbi:hypothetical protein R3P38DRAFT_2985066 [Favolaschia claudopus]|uniref:Uncharacterized protein n=1 Tax=Favolaschia claudopus TaxID=2862362 RepID=A0AAW0AWX9_9AGAR